MGWNLTPIVLKVFSVRFIRKFMPAVLFDNKYIRTKKETKNIILQFKVIEQVVKKLDI